MRPTLYVVVSYTATSSHTHGGTIRGVEAGNLLVRTGKKSAFASGAVALEFISPVFGLCWIAFYNMVDLREVQNSIPE